MKKVLLLFLIINHISCNKLSNKDNTKTSVEVSKDDKNKFLDKRNPNLFYIIKLDSIDNLYVLYAKKKESYYKILSVKQSHKMANCDKVQLFHNYDFYLESIVPDTSKISLHVDGVLFENTEVDFEKDSIWDLYKTPQLYGLCYFNKKDREKN